MCIRDRDIVFHDEINEVKITKEGSTTTSAAILYDILRKISSNSELNFDLKSENKLSLKSDNADFNLLCLPTDNFPTFSDEFEGPEISLNNTKFLKLLNKTKIAISNDDSRHYLNGIFLHLTDKKFSPTKGCVAIKKNDFLKILSKIEKKTKIIIR